MFDPQAVRLAISDLKAAFPDRYRNGARYLRRLDEIERRLPDIREGVANGRPEALREVDGLLAFQREALLANPLLDFDRLLLIRRRATVENPVKEPAVDPKKGKRKKVKKPKAKLGLPQNWQGNCSLPKTGYDNEIALLSPISPDGKLTTVFRPPGGAFVGDVDLHFDADRMRFSMPSKAGTWQVFEVGVDGGALRQVTPGDRDDVDNYDACYLPDGRILFTSTANMQGVPCIGGKGDVANLARLETDGKTVRMLAFEQDHDWCPTLLSNGRVLYTRWEYTDTPHYFTRLLMSMNPDGTNQVEFYGSNSYWPNALFYARPIPGHPTQFAAIVSGHHGVPRMGELVLFDAARGQHEADGAIQRIPGRGQKVEPIIRDGLVNGSWPKFLHPYPLSDKYLLVACQPGPKASWGIYLADVFDNLVLIKELPGNAPFEPIPLERTPRPPVIPDRVNLARKDATVYVVDVYRGPVLAGVPRGTVKNLRVISLTVA